MRSLTLVATADCNLRCEYCYLPIRRERRRDWASQRRALELLLQRAATELSVTITGGEPLVAFPRVREVVTFVEGVRPAGATVHWKLLTNGLLLDADSLAFLDAHGFTIRVSFDGTAPAQSLRGSETFERLDTLLELLRMRFNRLFRDRLELSTVLTPRTINDFGASMEYFLEKRVQDVAIAPAMGEPGWKVEQFAELDAAFARVSASALRHYISTCEVPLRIFRKTRWDSLQTSVDSMCGAPDPASLAVDVDGQVAGCVLATASYQAPRVTPPPAAVAALRVGSPDDQQFDDNLAHMPAAGRATGAFVNSERRSSSYRRCSECEYFGRCRICPLAGARHPTAPIDPDRVQDFLCAFNMISLAHRDRFPCQPDNIEILTGGFPRFVVSTTE